MKLLFVYPSDCEATSIISRYDRYAQVLYQRDQIVCLSMPSRRFLDAKTGSRTEIDQFDVIILHIAVLATSAKEIQHWKARDKLIIGDLSSPVILNENQESYTLYPSCSSLDDGSEGSNRSVDRNQLLWTIKLTDGLITNSEVMQREWKGIRPTRYIPDYAVAENVQIKPREKQRVSQIGIVINSGGFDRLVDCAIYPEIERSLMKHPDCRLVIFGEHPHQAHQLQVPPAQKLFIASSDRSTWQNLLSEIDICLLPYSGCVDERIGRLDILELMLYRIPWVASSIRWLTPYQQFGWVIENTAVNWEKTINDLMEHGSYYQSETLEGYLFALSQCLEENAYKLIEYISMIIRAKGAG